jgi:predicted RND superfamily exporter protein
MSARERIHTGLEHFTGWVYDHAWLTIAAVLLCVGALATQLPNLRLEGRVEAFLHEDDPLRVTYDEFRHQFGRDDLILLTLESPDLFEARSLERLRALHDELERGIPYLEEITSLVNARETRGEADELIVGELLEDWPESDAARAAVRERALANRLYRDLLISEDAGLSVMVIELSRGEAGDDVDELLAGFDDPAPAPTNGDESAAGTTENTLALAAVSEIVAAHQAPDFRIHVTGTGAFTEYLQQAMRRDMSRFTALGVLTIAVLLALLFRSLAGVLLPLLVVVLSLVVTLSLMAALDEPIAMPTQILPSFLLAVGVGGAVHLVAIFFQNQRAGLDKRASIVGAVEHSGLAIIMTSLTTAGAMASFATASLAPIAGLGLCAPGGVMMALAVTLVLLPALVAVFPVSGGATPGSRPPSGSPAWWAWGG